MVREARTASWQNWVVCRSSSSHRSAMGMKSWPFWVSSMARWPFRRSTSCTPSSSSSWLSRELMVGWEVYMAWAALEMFW